MDDWRWCWSFSAQGFSDVKRTGGARTAAALSDFPDGRWGGSPTRTSDTHNHFDDPTRADAALTYYRTARGYSVRIDGKRKTAIMGTPLSEVAGSDGVRRLFCPALHGLNLQNRRLTDCVQRPRTRRRRCPWETS